MSQCKRPEDGLQSNLNLILVGIMGSGKTTCARLLARQTGRELVDIDELIAQREGCSISEIFARRDESYFRELEAAAVQELSQRRGIIIATGGGTILREESVRALRRSGIVIWLDRPAEQIFGDENLRDRPLAQNGRDAFLALADKRHSLYHYACHAVVREFSSPPVTVQAILREWERCIAQREAQLSSQNLQG